MSDDPNQPIDPTEPVIVPASDLPPTEAIPPVLDGGEPTAVMPPVAQVPPPTDPNHAIPNSNPDPHWYDNRAAVGAVIAAGLLGLFLLIAWLLWWSDDDDASLVADSTTTAVLIDSSTIPVDSTSTIPPGSIVSVVPASTIDVTLPPETTAPTTVPPTTAPPTTAPATTAAPTTAPATTTTSIPVVTVPPGPSATVMDVIAASPDLSRLNQLIIDADLVEALSGEDPVTLFAPSNPAIETVEAAPGGAELLSNPERLRDLLLGHVVAGALDESTIFASSELPTAAGTTLVIDGTERTVDGATLLVTDVEGANGFIQVIDRVLNVS